MEKNQVSASELGQRLERIETLLRGQKEILTFDEAAVYIGISKSYLYKLTAGCKVPHYKPEGKTLYFDRLELEAWLRRNRVKTVDEIEREAAAKVMTLGKGGKRK